MMRIFLSMFIFVMACNDTPVEGNRLARLGFYADSDTVIAELSAKKKTSYEYFLLGEAHRDKKQYKDAIFNFANSCFLYHHSEKLTLYPSPVYNFISGFHVKSPLYDEAVYEIADLFMKYREHAYVVKFADEVSNEMPGLWYDARVLKAQALAEAGKTDESLSELNALLRDYADVSSRQFVNIKIASLFEKRENYITALDRYCTVIGLDEKSWQAQLAAKRIVYIEEYKSSAIVPVKLLTAGRGLYHAGEYAKALGMFERPDLPDRDIREKDRFSVRCLVRLNKVSGADEIIGKYRADAKDLAEFLSIKADELWDSGRQFAAVPVYKEIIETAQEPWSQKALGRSALYLGDRGAQGSEKLLAGYKDRYSDETAETCLWLLGKNALKKNDTATAARYFGESVEKYPAGNFADRCKFWLYKLSEKAGDTKKSRELFRNMVVNHADSSYTWRLIRANRASMDAGALDKEFSDAAVSGGKDAQVFSHSMLFVLEQDKNKRLGRLQSMPGAAAPYSQIEKKISGLDLSSAKSGVLRGLEKYFVTGDMKSVNRELRLVNDDKTAAADCSAALAHYARKYGNYTLAVSSVQDLLKAQGLRENIFLSPDALSMDLYPRGFEECLEGFAVEIDLAYVFAVIKAESNFNHAAVSPAGAVGLMQLMPATAGDVAKELKVADYSLKDPCTSVRFGTHYLSWLMRFFNGNIAFAVAGYNAGAGNVIKWRKEMPADDIDFFIEFVPFDETRGYMLRTDEILPALCAAVRQRPRGQSKSLSAASRLGYLK